MKTNNTVKDFGKRLAELRKTKGLTQTELGSKIGLSKRMVAYYEGEPNKHPAHLLVPIAQALKISLDELLGVKEASLTDAENAKLWRRLKRIEQLPVKDRRMLLDFLDALLVKSKKNN
jgi:transcriptional regulator with XRE-family HTH domain